MTGVTGAAISEWMEPLISKDVLIWCDEHGIQFPDEEFLEKAKRSGNAYVKISGTFGLPSPFDLAGDKRWLPDGELYREYDLELDDGADQKYYNETIVDVPPDIQNDQDKIIHFSNMNQQGVKVLSGNNGSQNKKIGDGGDGSANYSEFSEKKLNDEFAGIFTLN